MLVFYGFQLMLQTVGSFLDFINCRFINFTVTSMTVGMTHGITGGGLTRFIDSTWVGATALSDNYTGVYSGTPIFDGPAAGQLTIIS